MSAKPRPTGSAGRRRTAPVAALGVLLAASLLAACSGSTQPTAGTSPSAAVGSPSAGTGDGATPTTSVDPVTEPGTATSGPTATSAPTTPAASPSTTGTATPRSTPTTIPTTIPTTTSPAATTASPGATSTPSAKPSSGSGLAPPTKPGPTGPTLVAYYGTGGTDGLGILGRGNPQQAWDAVAKRAKGFDRPGEPAVPMFEFIATVASSTPGRSGDYRNRVDDSIIEKYVKTATDNGGQIILDVQPGRSDFLTESKVLQKWLTMPNVGLALDPEWRMGPGQVPAKVIGSVNAAEINQVSAWLDQLTVANNLPTKLFVVHQFTSSMIRNESAMADRPHLREITNVDGFGTQKTKLSKYNLFAKESPYPLGLKLFTKKRNDPDLFTPAQAMALKPRPVLIDYQ